MKRVAALWSILAAGCSHMAEVNQALRGYERALAITVAAESREVFIGSSMPLVIGLENRSATAVSGCLGPGRKFDWLAKPVAIRDGQPPTRSSGGFVDHPTCKRSFSISAGEVLSWTEDVAVPDVGSGEAELWSAVEVLYPRRCHQLYGCYGAWLKGPTLTLALKRAAPPKAAER